LAIGHHQIGTFHDSPIFNESFAPKQMIQVDRDNRPTALRAESVCDMSDRFGFRRCMEQDVSQSNSLEWFWR